MLMNGAGSWEEFSVVGFHLSYGLILGRDIPKRTRTRGGTHEVTG